MTTADKIIALLTPGIGKMMAESSLKGQCKHLGIQIEAISPRDLPELAQNISKALVMFVGTDKAKKIEQDILKC